MKQVFITIYCLIIAFTFMAGQIKQKSKENMELTQQLRALQGRHLADTLRSKSVREMKNDPEMVEQYRKELLEIQQKHGS